MKVMVTGAKGQLGRAFLATAPPDTEVIGLDREALDVANASAVLAKINDKLPDLIINAAAYTAVDRAELEPSLALRVNGDAVQHLATAARSIGARLVQISTDFIFDGRRSTPYPPDAEPAPLSTYGQTKLAGERAAGDDALIIRTAWLYSAQGHNFVNTVLRILREGRELRVVSDQVGTPCLASGLARAVWQLAAHDARGVLHYSDSGVASWYDFAVAIQEEALAAGILNRETVIDPVRTTEFPTSAARPAYSVLEKEGTWARLGYKAPHWRANLRHMLKELSNA